MKKELKYSEQDALEDASKQHEEMIKRKQKSLATKIFNQCKEGGKKAKGRKQLKSLRTIELQLIFLEDHPNTQLPMPELTHSETVEAWKTGIADYKHDISFESTT